MKIDQVLTSDTLNAKLLHVRYEVMGQLVTRAALMEREIEKGVVKPFARVIRANLGDVHAMGRKPITFIRQVLVLVTYPQIRSEVNFPDDVRERAQLLIDDCPDGSVGAFSPAAGMPVLRSQIAQYLEARDGVPAFADDVFVGAGVADLAKAVLSMFVAPVCGKPPAVMVPTPQYPLFSATLAELGLRQANYYLDEEHHWALRIEELERSWREASEDCHVRALVAINPGNPTGKVLSPAEIELIIKFAHEHNVFLVVDEVYQESLITKPFYSFKKIMYEMGAPYSSMELASITSISKGWACETGLRSGYVELLRLDPAVLQVFQSVRNVTQCPSVLGQCATSCVVNPPQPGQPSYDLFVKETRQYYQLLAERAAMAYEVLNSIPGYSCQPIEASTFAYPRVDIPKNGIKAATEIGMSPDEFYCMRMLEETGICVVPGTGFGQQPGTYHFRITILNPRDDFQYMLDSFRKFHDTFVQKYS